MAEVQWVNSGNDGVLKFLFLVGKVKTTVRTGWTRYPINKPESVADHMYRMSMMALILPDLSKSFNITLDCTRILKMAIVHDLAECITGDITPLCGYTRDEKLKKETDAMHEICDSLSQNLKDELFSLWDEYNNQQTAESNICKDFDRLDMIMQAYEYETIEKKPDMLQDFFNSTEGKFKSEIVKSLVEQLYKKRNSGDEL